MPSPAREGWDTNWGAAAWGRERWVERLTSRFFYPEPVSLKATKQTQPKELGKGSRDKKERLQLCS